MTLAPTVFVVDDDPSILKALARLLTAAALNVRTYGSADQFLEAFDAAFAGCLVLDIEMPGLSGMELQRALSDRHSTLPIVFLTGRLNVPTSVQAMKLGAVDFLMKPVDESALLDAIGRAFEQDRVLRGAMLERQEIERRAATLTPREREVLVHVVSGRRNKQIAADLGTVEKTIKVHRARVMDKMQVRSLADLVRVAGKLDVSPGPAR